MAIDSNMEKFIARGGDENPLNEEYEKAATEFCDKFCTEFNMVLTPVQRRDMITALRELLDERVPCPNCHQVNDGSIGGEYACLVCGVPTMHDPE
jgi:hypothetical protein